MRVTTTPQFWWRLAIVVCGVLGLLLGDHRIAYFTSQSNLITVGYFAGVLYWMVHRGTTEPPAPRLRGAVTLWILITCLVSHVMLNHGENPLPGLADLDPAEALRNWSAFLVHYVVPVLVLTDWIVFGPHRVVPWRTLPLWILFPLGYGVVMEARAAAFPAVPSRYPYFFLDPTGHGYGWVAGQMVQLGVIFAVLGALVLGADRLAGAAAGRWSRTPATAVPEAAGAETTGAETAGAETAGAETTGAETTGAETTGAEATGAEAARSEAASAEAAGAKTARS